MAAAAELIESEEQCFIKNIVLCEMVWVLSRNRYKFGKDEILSTLEVMLQSIIFEFENCSAVYQALQRAQRGRADFADCLIGAIVRQLGCDETATFDRKLQGEKGFNYLLQ